MNWVMDILNTYIQYDDVAACVCVCARARVLENLNWNG